MNAQTKIEPPKSILGALAAALPELEGAKKNKANPAFKSKYADLGAVIEAIQPIASHGLWFRQVSHEREGGVCVETFYIHESGELSAGTFFVPADRNNAQGFGSANSYARRYGLQLAFGLATEDDDGNAASRAVAGQSVERTVSQQQPISDEQLVRLQSLIQATKSNVNAFCQRLKVDALNNLPSNRFGEALYLLESKLEKMAKADTDAKAKEPA